MRILIMVLITAAAVLLGNGQLSHAQARSTATPTPIPTAIPVGGLWLEIGHGQAFQGECTIFSEPVFYSNGEQWQISCMPLEAE